MSVNQNESDSILVRRGKMDSITVFEVTEDELGDLQKSADDGIYFNFFLVTISVLISFLISILTTDIASIKLYIAFMLIVLVSFVFSLLFFALWLKDRNKTKTERKNLIAKIRARIGPDASLDREPTSETSVNKIPD